MYDSVSLRRFVGIDLGREPVPDATTMLKFRKLLHDNKLGETLFAQVGAVLQSKGFKVNTGTIVDATIIGAPSSTKNADKARDPEMRQTRKGQQWYFGMKLHIGVDSQSGLAHSAVVTSANVHDKHPRPDLLHEREQRVYGVVKRLWGFGKVRYRGLQKNATRAFTALALANIYLSRQRLMAQVRP